jgi:cation transport ATPase
LRIPTCIRLGRLCRHAATVHAAIGLGWTVAIVFLAALGVLNSMWGRHCSQLVTFIVVANAGRLLRVDENAA